MSNTEPVSPFTTGKPVLKEPPTAPQWTLWEETSSMVANLLSIEKHCQQMRADIDQGVRTLERMIGQQAKR